MLVGESAIWHEVESALYWVDIEGLTVNRLHAASGKFSSWKMGSNPSALAIDDNNFLVVATRERLLRLNTTDGAETPIADAPYDTSKVRFNDGRVDPAGRFWIGTMYEPRDQPAAEMYVLARDNLRCAWRGGDRGFRAVRRVQAQQALARGHDQEIVVVDGQCRRVRPHLP